MKYLLALIPLLFLFTTTSANATDYFYCDCQAGASGQCVAGNDSNNGTSTSSPRQTFSNANTTFNRFAAGDSIQFCRGGSFTVNKQHRWTNNKCTTSNTCTVTSYDLPGQQSPQLAHPIITQSSTGHLFDLTDGASANHEEGYIFNNLDLRCTGCTSGASYGFFFYNDVNHVTISNLSIDGFNIGVHLAGGGGTHDFITLQNLTIINNSGQGILGGANNLNIKDSRFENNGGGNNRDHNLYLSRGNNITISGNDFYRSSVDANNVCRGTSLVVHGIVNNMLIENNIIHEDIGKAGGGCTGISVAPGYTKAESFTNIMIRGNKLINIGQIGIGVGACDNCIIENNVILQQQPSLTFNAIKAPTKLDTVDITLNKVTIRNNSIYTSSSGTGINLGVEGTQHTVVSNAIHYTGTEKFTCFNLGLATSAYTAINNNTCYFPNALASSEWEAGSGTNPSPLGAWQGQSGFDANSQNVNPGFKDPTLPLLDLSPQSNTSSIVGAGHNTSSSPKDYRGKTRDAQPDAGAFEFGTFNPPAKTNIYPN